MFDGRVLAAASSEGVLRGLAALPPGSVFSWESLGGLTLALYADATPSAADAESWQLLLEYESQRPQVQNTFFPFFPSLENVGAELNALIAEPAVVVILNGQPGTGKRSILQSMALFHAGLRVDTRHEVAVSLKTRRGSVVVVPELALLEVAEQQALLRHIKDGGTLWGATVYDMVALKNRKILQPAFADALIAARMLLAPVAKREEAELETMASFWLALHGLQKPGAVANLAFQKARALGKEALSVESILEEGRGLRGVIAEFEKEAILKAQARVGRSQHKIANLLKVSRGSLQHKLRKYQLESYASPDADTDNEA